MSLLASPRFWIRTAFLFLLRSGRTTSVLSLMVFSAVGTLVYLSSLAVGINDAMIRNSVSLFSGHITASGLPADLTPEDLKTKNVVGVLRRATLQGVLTHGDRFAVVALVGVDPEGEKKFTAVWKKTVQGRYPTKGEQAVFIGLPVAEKLGVTVDGTLQFRAKLTSLPVSFTVSGVFSTGIDQLDQALAFCPLASLPEQPDRWTAAIFVKEGADPARVVRQYPIKVRQAVSFKTWDEQMPDLKQLIDLNYVSMGIVMVLVFGVVCLGISCAFIIFIFKHLREYGIMKAMGVTPMELSLLILYEVVIMNLLASATGAAAGALAVFVTAWFGGIDLSAFTSYNRYFAVSGIIYPRLTPYSLCLPPVVAFLFSLVASLWPAGLVARKKAAEILRSV